MEDREERARAPQVKLADAWLAEQVAGVAVQGCEVPREKAGMHQASERSMQTWSALVAIRTACPPVGPGVRKVQRTSVWR